MFKNRSTRKELLDAEDIPQQDLYRNLYELERINTLLGGHAVTIAGLKKLNLDPTARYRVLDIGSGGGDTLKHIAKWARKKGYQFELTGVDLKKDCIDYATQFCKEYPEITFVQSDYRELLKEQESYDIIVTSLFCHHLTNEELKGLFTWCAQHATIAFIFNDLHRHPLAFYSIAFLTQVFSNSYLVKNDAKLSVLRGFTQNELQQLLKPFTFELHWKWAFRWLGIIRTQQ